jgi:hypothetical protein
LFTVNDLVAGEDLRGLLEKLKSLSLPILPAAAQKALGVRLTNDKTLVAN